MKQDNKLDLHEISEAASKLSGVLERVIDRGNEDDYQDNQVIDGCQTALMHLYSLLKKCGFN